jgi:hypothetical protein
MKVGRQEMLKDSHTRDSREKSLLDTLSTILVRTKDASILNILRPSKEKIMVVDI